MAQQQVFVVHQPHISTATIGSGQSQQMLKNVEGYDFIFYEDGNETGRIRITGGGQIHYEAPNKLGGYIEASRLFRQIDQLNWR